MQILCTQPHTQKKYTTMVYAVVCGVLVFLLGMHVLTVQAAPNLEINYQGKLTDTSGAAVSDGSYNMRFYLYDTVGVATTSAIWTETWLVGSSNGVQVTNGLFSVMLGSTTALTSVDFNQTLYLGVEIGGTGGTPTWDDEMSPRKIIGAVPAAFEAQKLSGIASSSFLRSDQDDTATGLITFIGTTTHATATFDLASTTNLRINNETFTDLTGTGLFITSGTLNVGNLATDTLSIGGTYGYGALLQASTTASGGYAWTATSTLGLIDGAGDTDRVAFWTDGDTLSSNSGFTFASNILTAPSFVASGASATSTFAGGLAVNTSGLVYDFTTGFVGIGTAVPSSRLTVAGNTFLDSNLITFASSSASTLTINYAAAATSTITGNAPYAWTIATSTTGDPIFAIETATNDNATVTIDAGLSINGGSIEHIYDTGVTSIDNLELGALYFETNAGQVSWVDLPVSTTTSGIAQSYTAFLDSNPMLTIYGTTDGSGGVTNRSIGIGTTSPSVLLTVGSTTPTHVSGYRDAFFAGAVEVDDLLYVDGSGTSTFVGGIEAAVLNITGSATSTYAKGIDLSDGCFAINGTCVTASGLGGIDGAGDTNRVAFFSDTDTLTSDAGFTFASNILTAPSFVASGASATSTFAGGLNIASGGLVYDFTSTNVGIGIANPGFNVHVQGANGEVATIMIQSDPNDNAVLRYRDGTTSQWAVGNNASNDAYILSTGTDLSSPVLTALQSGLVGIGSSTPNTLLTLEAAEDTALIALGDSTNGDQANIYTGTTSPEGRVTAPIGSLFVDTVNGELYQKTGDDGGNTSWGVFTQGTTTHMAKMTRDTATSVPTNSQVVMDFDNVEYDTGGIANVSNERFEIKRAGKYLVTALASLPGIGDALNMTLTISINGTDRTTNKSLSPVNTQTLYTEVSDTYDLSPGDYIEMKIRHIAGSPQDTSTTEDQKPRMSVIELAATGGNGSGSLFTNNGGDTYLTETTDDILFGTTTNQGNAKLVIQQQNAADIVNIFDGANEVFTILDGGNVGIGTTSPSVLLTVGSTTPTQVSGYRDAFFAGAAEIDDILYVDGSGTSTFVGGLQTAALNITGSATSTYNQGINLSDGCFAVNGTCIGGGSSVSFGSVGQIPYSNSGGNGFDYSSGFTFASNILTVDGNINVSDPTTGYSIDGNLVLYASSTSSSTLVGINAGSSLLSDGINNTALGRNALAVATSSDANTAIGYNALTDNTTGYQNTAVGFRALEDNTTSINNTAVGWQTLLNNSTGGENSAFGSQALTSNTTGIRNTALGRVTLVYNKSGDENIAGGFQTMYHNRTGSNNTVFGSNAFFYNYSATNSVALGHSAGRGTAAYGAGEVTAIGTESLYNIATGAEDNTALGYRAGYGVTTGANNILLGFQAGDNLTTGSNNIIIGYDVNATANNTSNQLNIGNTIYGNTSSGFVGIGTDSPDDFLHIFEGESNAPWHSSSYLNVESDGHAFISIGSGATSYGGLLFADSGGNGVGQVGYNHNGDYLYFVSNATEQARINSSGYLGIGTTTPTEKLTVGEGSILVTQGDPVKVGGIAADDGSTGVAVRGDYAYVVNGSAGQEFQIFNIADKTQPRLVGEADASAASDGIALSGDYAYIVSDNASDELEVFDISDPTAPVKVGGTDLGSNGNDIVISGHYAYAVSDSGGEDLEIFDITDPTTPTKVGGAQAGANAIDVAVVGDYAYVVSGSGGDDIEIFDVSDPYSPVKLGGTDTADNANGVAVRGNYAYVVSGSLNDDLEVFDIRDPSAPVKVGGAGALGTVRDIAISGDYVYIAAGSGTDDLEVYDISSSTNPIKVGGVAASGALYDIVVDGNYAYTVTTGTHDLEIFKLSGVRAPTGEIGTLLADNVRIVDTLRANNAFIDTGLSVGHNANIGGALTITGIASSSLQSGNTRAALVVESGNVGIGTSTPAANLTVNGTTGQNLFQIATSTNQNILTVTENGLIGLGTANPLKGLDIAIAGSKGMISFSGTNGGGGEGIVYNDSGGTSRYGLFFPGSDIVALANRASNGVVHIRANTATAGGGGEVTVGVFADNEIQLLPSGGNVGIASSSPGSLLSVGGSSSGINFSTATSTFSTTGGISLSDGCFAINGSCIGGGGSSPFTTTGSTTYLTTQNERLAIGTTSAWGRLSISSENNTYTWQQAGSGLSIATVDTPALAALSPNRVAFIDASNEDLRVYEFDGSSWSQIGNDLNISGIGAPALAALSPNRVAFIDATNASLRVYEFDGSSWSLVGSGLTISGATTPALAALSPNRVAFIDATNDSLRVYEFNGSTWSLVGSGLSISTVGNPALAALSPNRVAFIDATNDSLRVYEFNGSTWSLVGGGSSVTNTSNPALTTLSSNRVAFIDLNNDNLRVYEFDSNTWSQVGSGLAVSTVGTPALTTLSSNRVAFIDNGNDSLRTYQFSQPLFFAGNDEDYPYFSLSDSGYTNVESLFVNAGLQVHAAATGTGAINGTSSPALTIWGSTYAGGDILPSANLLYNLGGQYNRFDNLWASTLNVGTSTWSIFNGVDGRLAFSNAAEQGGSEFLSIDTSGNIGIGTSTPAANLTVNGTTGKNLFQIASSTAQNIFVVNENGYVGIASSSPSSLLSVGDTNGINFSTATSTFSTTGGINLTDGCFAIDGSCIGGGDSSPFTTTGSTTYLTTQADRLAIGTTSAWGRLSVSSENNTFTWVSVADTGTGDGDIGTPSLTALSPNSVAFFDAINKDLRTYEFDGVEWSLVGSELNISGVSNSNAIAALSPNRIAYFDAGNKDLRVYEFNGSTWSQVGNDLNISTGGGFTTALAPLSPNRVVFINSNDDKLRVYEFNGTDWNEVGTSLSITLSTFDRAALAQLSPNRVVYFDDSNKDLRVYEFNGSTWSQIGSDLNISGAGPTAITTLSPSRVAFIDSTNADLRVYEFNGSTWSQIGSDLNISGSNVPALATLSANRVAFIHADIENLYTYQFSQPLFFVGNDEDFPYFTISDAGYTQAESMFVRTGLTVGQSATATDASTTPALVVQGTSVFQSNAIFEEQVGIGTSTPYANFAISGFGGQSTPLFEVASSSFDTSYFRIAADGKVGISTTTPWADLTIDGFAVADYLLLIDSNATSTIAGGLNINNGALVYDYGANKTSIERLDLGAIKFEQDAGKVSWIDLDVSSTPAAGTPQAYSAQIDGNQIFTIYAQADGSGGITDVRTVVGTSSDSVLGSSNIPYGSMIIADGALCVDDGEGDAATCASSARSAGGIYSAVAAATGLDLAERYPTKDNSLEVGEIVMVDDNNPIYVSRYEHASYTVESYATTTGTTTTEYPDFANSKVPLGVVSTKPGVILGGFAPEYPGEKEVDIALTGRVPVTVTNEHGSIAVGDRIMPSFGNPGMGMKATSSGYVIGIALEPVVFASTSSSTELLTATTTVFVDQQYYYAPSEFYVDARGNVGIGTTTPGYDLQVAGTIAANAFVNVSTREAKKDIEHLEDVAYSDILEKIASTSVAQYHYNFESEESPLRLGLIAEEAPSDVLSLDGKGVDLYQLSAFTLAGVKAQQKEIDSVSSRLANIEALFGITNVDDISGSSIASTTELLLSPEPSGMFAQLRVLGEMMQLGFAHFGELFADTLEIGSPSQPAGVTLYDQVTGAPYCLKIARGEMVSTRGTCEDPDTEWVPPSSGGGNNSDSGNGSTNNDATGTDTTGDTTGDQGTTTDSTTYTPPSDTDTGTTTSETNNDQQTSEDQGDNSGDANGEGGGDTTEGSTDEGQTDGAADVSSSEDAPATPDEPPTGGEV